MINHRDESYSTLSAKLVGAGAIKVRPVGSRVICDPAPTDTDFDVLVHASNRLKPEDLGFICTSGTDEYNNPQGADRRGFLAYRKGVYNLIVTYDSDFFHNFLDATRLATHLNLLDKQDRVALFQYILYSNLPEEAPYVHHNVG